MKYKVLFVHTTTELEKLLNESWKILHIVPQSVSIAMHAHCFKVEKAHGGFLVVLEKEDE